MPRIFLEKTDRARKIAEAIKQFAPGAEVRETERAVMVSSSGIVRVDRGRLEQFTGEQFSDDEWNNTFKKATGEVRRYDQRVFVIEEEPPGDY